MNGDRNESWEKAMRMDQEAIRGMPVPSERLDEAIRAGVRRASAVRRRIGRIRRVLLSAGAGAAALLMILIVSMRVSPVFAEAVAKWPGLEYLARWFHQIDRGLEMAVRNDHYQPLGAEDAHDGLTLRLEGAIPDERRLVLFYTVLKDGVPASGYQMTDLKFRLPGGELFSGSYGYSYYHGGEDEKSPIKVLDIDFTKDSELPNEFILETSLTAGGVPLGPRWEIPVRLEQWRGNETVYELNRWVSIEGQNVLFKNVTLFPTRIGVEVQLDENNDKLIFSFLDLRLTGDEGEVFTQKSAMWIDDRTRMIYFEGSSFAQPDALTLSGSAARALDKANLDLVVNTERGVLLQAPDDRVVLEDIFEIDNGWIELKFRLSGIAEDDNMLYSLIGGYFTDASGRRFTPKNSRVYGGVRDEGTQTVTVGIPAKEYVQPLHFQIANYPSYIREPFEIRLR